MPPSKYSRQVARRIRQVRGDRTLRAFAKDLGTNFQNISRWEQGVLPDAAMMTLFAKREKVSLNWLMLGQGERDLA